MGTLRAKLFLITITKCYLYPNSLFHRIRPALGNSTCENCLSLLYYQIDNIICDPIKRFPLYNINLSPIHLKYCTGSYVELGHINWRITLSKITLSVIILFSFYCTLNRLYSCQAIYLKTLGHFQTFCNFSKIALN